MSLQPHLNCTHIFYGKVIFIYFLSAVTKSIIKPFVVNSVFFCSFDTPEGHKCIFLVTQQHLWTNAGTLTPNPMARTQARSTRVNNSTVPCWRPAAQLVSSTRAVELPLILDHFQYSAFNRNTSCTILKSKSNSHTHYDTYIHTSILSYS